MVMKYFRKVFKIMIPLVVALSESKSIHAQYQERALVYDIMRKDDKIGTVLAVKVTNGTQEAIRIETHMNVQFVVSVKVDLVVGNSFRDDVLLEAFMRKDVNGTVKINNSIFRKGNFYNMIDKDRDTTFLHQTLSESVSTLYFEEPVNTTTIFSETFLKLLPLKKTESSTYQLSLPDGNTNYYRYEKGVCTEVIIETQLSTVHLRLRSNKEG